MQTKSIVEKNVPIKTQESQLGKKNFLLRKCQEKLPILLFI